MMFTSSLVDLSGEYMAMTQPSMLVFVHTSNGLLTILCFNDAFHSYLVDLLSEYMAMTLFSILKFTVQA